MGFLWIAYAAGAASIPIALHFFFRSRYRRVPWAAMKFLLAAIEQTSRRLRFQELLLLLLRVAVMILIALALIGRPSTAVSRAGAAGESLEAVFLFDTSYSMGAGDGGMTRLERAQDKALKIIDELPAHSTVQIYTCADRDEWLGPTPANDLKQAKRIVADLALSSLATDLTPGLRAVHEAVDKTSAPVKEVYIFSDMQKTGWDRDRQQAQKILKDLKGKAEITLVRCGHELPKDETGKQRDFKNLAVVGIKPQSGVPRPGERVDFAVIVKNTAGATIKAREMQLTLFVDGKQGDSQAVPQVEPGETRVVTMSAKMEKAGLHVITVLAKDDDLPGDNRYDLVLQVREHVNVLVVDGGRMPPGGKEPAQASSFYLGHALIPTDQKYSARYYLTQQVITPAAIAQPGLLTNADLCILVNVAMPRSDKAEDAAAMNGFLTDLAQFVKAGHGLIMFCGDRVIPRDYNTALRKHGLLTLPLVDTKDGKEVREARKLLTRISRKTFNLPAFEKFKEDKNFESFDVVEVHQAFEVDEKDDEKKLAEENKQKEAEEAKARAAERERLEKEWGDELTKLSGASKAELDKKVKDTRVRWAEEDRLAKEKAEREKKKLDPLTVVLRYVNPDARADRTDQQPGMPAVISRKIGKGEVFFITTSAEIGPPDEKTEQDFSWNNWAKLKCYSPFVQDSVNHLLHGTTQEYNLQAGDTLTWFPPDNDERAYTLIHPLPIAPSGSDQEVQGQEPRQAKQERLGTPQADDVTGGRPAVKASHLYTAGVYTMKGVLQLNKDEDGLKEKTLRRRESNSPLAVIPDLTESENLDCYKDGDLDELLGFQPRHVVAGELAPQSSADVRLSREWTATLLALLLFLALGESILAFFCGRSW